MDRTAKLLGILIGVVVIQTVAILILGAVLILGLLPKAERGVQVAERTEARFQAFADEVQPVFKAGAGKAVEALRSMDAGEIGTKATQGVNKTLDAAAERVKRALEKDKKPAESPQ